MLQVVQAFDRAPIGEVDTDDQASLDAKLDAAARACADRDGWPKAHERVAVLRLAGLIEGRRECFARFRQVSRQQVPPALSNAQAARSGRLQDG